MALTYTKVLTGPVTLSLGSTSPLTYTPLNGEAVKINVEERMEETRLVDGKKIEDQAGMDLTIEVTIDEIATADHATIKTKAAAQVDIEFLDVSTTPTLTISAPDSVSVHVRDGKSVLRVMKSVAAGGTIANLLSIA